MRVPDMHSYHRSQYSRDLVAIAESFSELRAIAWVRTLSWKQKQSGVATAAAVV